MLSKCGTQRILFAKRKFTLFCEQPLSKFFRAKFIKEFAAGKFVKALNSKYKTNNENSLRYNSVGEKLSVDIWG